MLSLIKGNKTEWDNYDGQIYKLLDGKQDDLDGVVIVNLDKPINKDNIESIIVNGFMDTSEIGELSKNSGIQNGDYIISLIDVTENEYEPFSANIKGDIKSVKLYRYNKDKLKDPLKLMKEINQYKKNIVKIGRAHV